ncbi:MAG: sigma-54-dependent Fis family transcriptional regulator [Chitinophagaceae bacterium]|nr:MAG: sigma-54-dependent Fis family transcriptional regulator [Chitinophagaceae bacterium]
MSKAEKILVVDDDMDIGFLLKRFLTKKGLEVFHAADAASALDYYKKEKVSFVLLDFRLGDVNGAELLKKFKDLKPEVPVVIITGYSDIKTAVSVVKLGAMDYITKPLLPEEIWAIVQKGLNQNKVVIEKTLKKKKITQNGRDKFLRGKGKLSRELYKQVELVAPTDYSVILNGESGTGKEVLAKNIHNLSKRKDAPFIAMDCGAISKDLAGSELFGHEKGSFTGAMKAKTGHFELANGGTLFLDEIANLSYEVQMSLLRVVQERKVKPIGSNKEIDVDIRIIVATNEDLMKAVTKGEFREDLYYRFNEFSIAIPPLRHRTEDIMDFAHFFLEQVNAELDKNITGFEKDVVKAFMDYKWPGNLRELRNIIKRAALLSEGNKVQAKTLPNEISNASRFAFEEETILDQQDGNPDMKLKRAARDAEYHTIIGVLKKVDYNKSKAAKMLNIDRKTLYNKLKKFED